MLRLLAFWAMLQVVLTVAVLGGSADVNKGLPYVGVGSALLFAPCALGGAVYYATLRRLRDRGVPVVAAVVPGGLPGSYRLRYSLAGVGFQPRVGIVADFDPTVRDTLRTAVRRGWPVMLVVDPRAPARYLVLPFPTGGPGVGGR